MNKLEIAHSLIVEVVKSQGLHLYQTDIERVFDIAEMMLAESEKREKEISDKKRAEIKELLNADSTFIEREGQHFDDVEWQPDWSLAPDNAVACAMDADNRMFWHKRSVNLNKGNDFWSGYAISEYLNHGYTGDWRDSLRVRPEGV